MITFSVTIDSEVFEASDHVGACEEAFTGRDVITVDGEKVIVTDKGDGCLIVQCEKRATAAVIDKMNWADIPKSCTITRKDFVQRLLDETKHIESKGLSREHIAAYRHAYAFDLASIIECGNPVDEFGMPVGEEPHPFVGWIQTCLEDES